MGKLQTNVGGTIQVIRKVQVNIGGVITNIKKIQANIGGTIVTVWQNILTFIFGTSYANATIKTDYNYYKRKVIMLDNTRFLLVASYRDTYAYTYAIVGTINADNSVTYGTPIQLFYGNVGYELIYLEPCLVDTNRVALASLKWSGSRNDSCIQMLTISGTTITAYNIQPLVVGNSPKGVLKIATNRLLVFTEQGVIHYDTSVNNLTTTQILKTFQDGIFQNSITVPITSNKFLVISYLASPLYQLKATIVNFDGTNFTKAANEYVIESGDQLYGGELFDAVLLGNNQVLLVWGDDRYQETNHTTGPRYVPKSAILTVNGDTVSVSQTTYPFYTNMAFALPKLVTVDSGRAIMFYVNSITYSNAQVCAVEIQKDNGVAVGKTPQVFTTGKNVPCISPARVGLLEKVVLAWTSMTDGSSQPMNINIVKW